MTYRRLRIGRLGEEAAIVFAVEELVRYLKRMDQELTVDVLVFERYEENRDGVLWVGQSEAFSRCLPSVQDAAIDDGILVDVQNGAGVITGTNARSVLMAAYRFLKELGCHWVRPGRDGERIVQRAITRPSVYVKEAPSYRHRGVCIEGADTYENILDMIDYLPKVGLNEYFVQFLVPGTFFERWYFHESNPYLEKEELTRADVEAMTRSLEQEIARRGICYHKTGHGWTCEPFGIDGTSWEKDRHYEVPEEAQAYLAEVNGKRALWENVPLNTNLCYSNPKVRRTIARSITRYCQENPQIDYLHFWLADGSNNHCECEACRQKRPSDWYVQMLNEIDAEMTEAGVATKLVFLLYVDLLWEPEQEKLKNQDRFVLMFAPITRVYGKCYGDFLDFQKELPPYKRNQLTMPNSLDENLEYLRRWQAGFSGDSFDYDYHLMWVHMADPGYEKSARNVFQDMKDLHKIGLEGMMSCQVHRCFFPTALPFNMMATALWDENADYETEARAYYRAAFGIDGDRVRRHMQTVSELLLIYEGPAFGSSKLPDPMCQDYAALREEICAFQEIIAQNVRQTGPCRKEWETLQFHNAYLSLLAGALEQIENGAKEEGYALLEQLFDLVNQNEPALQQVLDAYNMQNVLQARLKK